MLGISSDASASQSALIEATTRTAVCGNGIREDAELCDGSDIPATCSALGFPNGTLRCDASCDFDTALCTTGLSDGGGGGGGAFVVGEPGATPVSTGCERSPDVNGDGAVDLIDFSILAFWWQRNITGDAPQDLNCDGRVTLTDFSILAFHWTGS